jgi:hypothetical protein
VLDIVLNYEEEFVVNETNLISMIFGQFVTKQIIYLMSKLTGIIVHNLIAMQI